VAATALRTATNGHEHRFFGPGTKSAGELAAHCRVYRIGMNGQLQDPKMKNKTIALPIRSCQFHGGRTDRKGFLVFCGKPVVNGSSYCAEHYYHIYQRTLTIGATGATDKVVEEAAAEANGPVEIVQEAA
jgi:hypothetical protein